MYNAFNIDTVFPMIKNEELLNSFFDSSLCQIFCYCTNAKLDKLFLLPNCYQKGFGVRSVGGGGGQKFPRQ
jgi:hypothetical protein